MGVAWAGKIIGFTVLGIFIGVLIASIIWVLGKNPIIKIHDVSFYLAKSPFEISISDRKFNISNDIYIYQRKRDERANKYFVLVREESSTVTN